MGFWSWINTFLNCPTKLREAKKTIDRYTEDLNEERQKSTELNDKLQEKIIQISKLEASVPRPDPHEEFWNNKYPKQEISYHARAYFNTNIKTPVDVRIFFQPIDFNLKKIVNTAYVGLGQLNEGSFDDRALRSLKWVRKHFKFANDEEVVKQYEFWMFPFEALKYKRGDCDDGAILLANLMMAAGIPYWRIRLNAGDVKGGGHAYVTYCRETDNEWVVLDWCYWYDKTPIATRVLHKNQRDYYGIWFSWNERYAFGEMQTMKGMPKILKVKR